MAAVEIRLAEAERVELLDQFWMVPSPGICQSGGRPGVRLGLGTGTFHFWPFGKFRSRREDRGESLSQKSRRVSPIVTFSVPNAHNNRVK